LTGVLSSMQKDPVVSHASELLRLGLMPSPEELRAGKVGYFISFVIGEQRADCIVPRILSPLIFRASAA
jgi:hypothetical protein